MVAPSSLKPKVLVNESHWLKLFHAQLRVLEFNGPQIKHDRKFQEAFHFRFIQYAGAKDDSKIDYQASIPFAFATIEVGGDKGTHLECSLRSSPGETIRKNDY